MKIDFSAPKEAPEEFRALTFSAPPMAKGQGRPALLASQIYHQGIPPLPADCHPAAVLVDQVPLFGNTHVCSRYY